MIIPNTHSAAWIIPGLRDKKGMLLHQTERCMNIIETTATYFGVNSLDILSKNKTTKISYARQISVYLCRDITNISLVEMGRIMRGRHHSSIIYSCRLIKGWLDSPHHPECAKHILNIKSMINGKAVV